MMRIEKILNNNVAVSRTDDGKEIIVMGRGLAFRRRIGDGIPENLVEKVFSLQSSEITEKLQKLASEIPLEHILIAEEIIAYAEKTYCKKLYDGIHISLADHISTAIDRQHKELSLKNPLRWDIKRFYPEENAIGVQALDIIQKKAGIRLDDDEAAFIAMHFVNAEMNQNMSQIVSMTRIMNEILEIIKQEPGIEMDENSINYFRFITHLKFFAQRILEAKTKDDDARDLYDLVKQKYSRVLPLTEKVASYLLERYTYIMDLSEKTYFTLHLQRIMKHTTICIASPLDGTLVPITEVKDEAFSKKMMGEGVAILPDTGKVFAPADGEVDTFCDTFHAVGIHTGTGVDVLIHIGRDTVKLGGKYFTPHIKEGDKVKKGQLLIEFDMKAIKEAGYDITTPVTVVNTAEFSAVYISQGSKVHTGDTILTVEGK